MSVFAGSLTRGLAGWTTAAFVALAAGSANAAVLVQQLPLDGGAGFYASGTIPQQLAEDDITLSGPANVERIRWWGGYDGNTDAGDDDFLVRVYTSVSGTGTVLQEFGSASVARTATSLLDGAGNDVFEYTFDLTAPLALSGGTYFLFVQNLGSSDWFWQQAVAGNGVLWFRGGDGDSWGQAFVGDLALQLDGTPQSVPEPSSLALLGLAALGGAFASRRRTRAQA